MQSNEIRSRFLAFFEKRGHKIIPSSSLVPENDPSVLFNTAGMQPLVPYLLGQEHPMGKRIADIQKCVRTGDLDDIGDNRHFSFFEMMGNWSLGDYFKEEAIKWSYEFLTSPKQGLGLDPKRLYITVFEGDENAPLDTESKEIWMKVGIPENRIYALPAEDNWWSPGDNGPCGPCSEMFYDMSGNTGDLTHEQFLDAVKTEKVIEIWNDVFMEYEKKDGKVIGKLKQKNVDTGAGLERITAVMQGKQTAYDTDLFEGVMDELNKIYPEGDVRSKKIIADHVRTCVFLISDGVIPGSTGRGYVLRRLLRRAILKNFNMANGPFSLSLLIDYVISKYKDNYSEINNENYIKKIFNEEELKFRKTLKNGLNKIDRIFDQPGSKGGEFELDAKFLFDLYQTDGYPFELAVEEINNRFDKLSHPHLPQEVSDHFKKLFTEHQKLSQTASAGMFKGGLANHNEKTIRLHTAHHLLLAALQEVVSKDIKQRGSNITEERLRIDFLCDHKLTDEEKNKVEDLVNEKIQLGLNVVRREMPLIEAEKIGAQMEFGAKYPETVSVYFIEPLPLLTGEGRGEVETPPQSSPERRGGNTKPFSVEFCGGPHISNTKELGHFKIQKEEAVAQGIRRIKAILE